MRFGDRLSSIGRRRARHRAGAGPDLPAAAAGRERAAPRPARHGVARQRGVRHRSRSARRRRPARPDRPRQRRRRRRRAVSPDALRHRPRRDVRAPRAPVPGRAHVRDARAARGRHRGAHHAAAASAPGRARRRRSPGDALAARADRRRRAADPARHPPRARGDAGRRRSRASAATVADAVAAIERDAPDLVVLDVQMPGGTGLDVVRRSARRACRR